jgi:hypothetical protein
MQQAERAAVSASAPSTAWEKTPWWMIWKPSMRRVSQYVFKKRSGKFIGAIYEYQHPAFVAREALAKRFDPDEQPVLGRQAQAGRPTRQFEMPDLGEELGMQVIGHYDGILKQSETTSDQERR